MAIFPVISQEDRLRKLNPPGRPVRMVLDTDTYNEIDDQFAVVYGLISPEAVKIEAFYAAPFHNTMSEGPADGMERSYLELLKIRKLMDAEQIPVYRGATTYMPTAHHPVESEAARDLVRRAMACDPAEPLYVVAIAALTNVASALLMEPRIAERIVIVWLGGHAFHWPNTDEFNLMQDVSASRIIFDCGAPVVLIPCMGVASHLKTTLSEVEDYVGGQGEIGSYLQETYRDCASDHFGYSRVIWDISVFAWLVNPEWCPSYLTPSPHIADELKWTFDPTRHWIRYVYYVDRDEVFGDLFRKLGQV